MLDADEFNDDSVPVELMEDVKLLNNSDQIVLSLSNLQNDLLDILFETTSMPHDICVHIVAYLPPQYQLIRINMMTYDSKYSLIEFALLILSHFIHYLITILYLVTLTNINQSNIWIFTALAIVCILETILIVTAYTKHQVFAGNPMGRIKLQITQFMNNRNMKLFAFIHIPLTIIVMFIKSNDNMDKMSHIMIFCCYFISLIIFLFYECYMHHRRKKFEYVLGQHGYDGKTNVEWPTSIYLAFIAIICLIFGIFYHASYVIVSISLFILYACFILNALMRPKINWFLGHTASMVYLSLLFLQLSICCMFGCSLWFTMKFSLIGLLINIFCIIELSLLLFYACSGWIQYRDNNYAATHNDDWYEREGWFFAARNLNAFIIHIPIYIVLMYYLYTHFDDNMPVLWWLAICSMTIYKIYQLLYNWWIPSIHNDLLDSLWSGGLECCVVTICQCIGSLILGIIWFSALSLTKNSNYHLFVLSIIFMVFGGISCLLCIPVYGWYYWFVHG